MATDVEGAIGRGLAADRLMQDSVMVEAFTGMREGLVRQLEAVPVNDRELAHELVLSLQLLAQLQKQLTRFIRDGQLEQMRKLQADKGGGFLRRVAGRVTV